MTAAIVETRINYRLPAIIEQHMRFLPEGTEIYIFTHQSAVEFYLKNVRKDAEIRLIVNNINSLNDYNRLMTSDYFWNLLPNGHCLIFQHDSMMLRSGIEEFFDYDYVGAPWKFQEHGGNGGLSLRRVEVMRQITNELKWNPAMGYEDVFFSNILKDYAIGNLAPREVCKKFSCETIFELGTLGMHAIEKYLTTEQVKQIKTQYD